MGESPPPPAPAPVPPAPFPAVPDVDVTVAAPPDSALSIAADFATVAGALTAAIALIFVLLQLRGLEKQLSIQVFAEYTSRYREIVAQLPADVFTRDWTAYTAAERARLLPVMRSYFDLRFEEWYLNDTKRMHPRDWTTVMKGFRRALAAPAFRGAWIEVSSRISDFDPNFLAYVNSLLSAPPPSPSVAAPAPPSPPPTTTP